MSKSRPEEIAVAFARILRGVGLKVPLDSVLLFFNSLGAVGLKNREQVYWSARACLLHDHEDQTIFDRAFHIFWDQVESAPNQEPETVPLTLLLDDENLAPGKETKPTSNEESMVLRFSSLETLRHKDFAHYSEPELRESTIMMASLRFAGSPKKSMRLINSKHQQQKSDIRRMTRACLSSDREPIKRYWRKPSDRLRRLVVLLDISGSMEPYSRALLQFIHAAVTGRQRVEAFTLGTRLTRITREMNNRNPDKALAKTSSHVQDWSGGTRLGDCLGRFNDNWGVQGMARGSILIILSDGWDRGDPKLLAEQMLRLHRVTYKTVWVNPLKVSPGYAPLARGMAAAMPFIDDFIEGHSIAALQHLTRIISQNQNRKVPTHA